MKLATSGGCAQLEGLLLRARLEATPTGARQGRQRQSYGLKEAKRERHIEKGRVCMSAA